jgi:signal transduction histidine kinase
MKLTGSRRLTRLVSTLMDVSRLEAGRLKGSFRLVNLGLVTRDLAVSLLSDNIDQS